MEEGLEVGLRGAAGPACLACSYCCSFITSVGPSSQPGTHGKASLSILWSTHPLSFFPEVLPPSRWSFSEPDSPGLVLDAASHGCVLQVDCQELGPGSSPLDSLRGRKLSSRHPHYLMPSRSPWPGRTRV